MMNKGDQGVNLHDVVARVNRKEVAKRVLNARRMRDEMIGKEMTEEELNSARDKRQEAEGIIEQYQIEIDSNSERTMLEIVKNLLDDYNNACGRYPSTWGALTSLEGYEGPSATHIESFVSLPDVIAMIETDQQNVSVDKSDGSVSKSVPGSAPVERIESYGVEYLNGSLTIVNEGDSGVMNPELPVFIEQIDDGQELLEDDSETFEDYVVRSFEDVEGSTLPGVDGESVNDLYNSDDKSTDVGAVCFLKPIKPTLSEIVLGPNSSLQGDITKPFLKKGEDLSCAICDVSKVLKPNGPKVEIENLNDELNYVPPGTPVSHDGESRPESLFEDGLVLSKNNSGTETDYFRGGGIGTGGYVESERKFGFWTMLTAGIAAATISIISLTYDGVDDSKKLLDNTVKQEQKSDKSNLLPDLDELFKERMNKGVHKSAEIDGKNQSVIVDDGDCRKSVYETILGLINTAPSRSSNPDYNKDGVYTNQNVINAVYWHANKRTSTPWRGGYGTKEQFVRANALLTEYGIDLYDLIRESDGQFKVNVRGNEFNDNIVKTDMVFVDVVPDCNFNLVGGHVDTTENDVNNVDTVDDVDNINDVDELDVVETGADERDTGAMQMYNDPDLDDKNIFAPDIDVPVYVETLLDEQAAIKDGIPIYIDESIEDVLTVEGVSDDIPLVPLTFAVEDKESIAEMYAQAVFDKESGFGVDDIQKFYKGVTPEIAKGVYLDELMNNGEQDLEIPMIVEAPVKLVEYIGDRIEQEIETNEMFFKDIRCKVDDLSNELDATLQKAYAELGGLGYHSLKKVA